MWVCGSQAHSQKRSVGAWEGGGGDAQRGKEERGRNAHFLSEGERRRRKKKTREDRKKTNCARRRKRSQLLSCVLRSHVPLSGEDAVRFLFVSLCFCFFVFLCRFFLYFHFFKIDFRSHMLFFFGFCFFCFPFFVWFPQRGGGGSFFSFIYLYFFFEFSCCSFVCQIKALACSSPFLSLVSNNHPSNPAISLLERAPHLSRRQKTNGESQPPREEREKQTT